MLDELRDALPKYLDKALITESAQAMAAVSPLRIAVYGLSGEAFHIPMSDGIFTFPFAATAHPQLAKGLEEARIGTACFTAEADALHGLAVAPIQLDEACVGFAAGVFPSGADAPATGTGFAQVMESLARLYGEVLEGKRSTADLSTELAERYEELSLVYTVTETMDMAERQDVVLDKILEAVAETLEADALVLRVPGLQLERVLQRDGAFRGSCRALMDAVDARLEKEDMALAVNDVPGTQDLASVAPGVKHLAAVHLNVDGQPGAIALLRGPGGHQLFMGDRKMLEAVAGQVSVYLANHKVTEARQQLFDSVIFGLARLAESRDPETGEHLERVSEYCRLLAQELSTHPDFKDRVDAQFVEDIARSSPLHDIGKVGISDAILCKPDKLTVQEFEIMKSHTIVGGDTLRDIEDRLHWGISTFLTLGREIAYFHHEKWSGGGYPEGFAEDLIPLPARIMALADVFDALTSRRCYKEPFPYEKARDIIVKDSGSHFDPRVVDAFLAVEDEFRRVMTELQNPL